MPLLAMQRNRTQNQQYEKFLNDYLIKYDHIHLFQVIYKDFRRFLSFRKVTGKEYRVAFLNNGQEESVQTGDNPAYHILLHATKANREPLELFEFSIQPAKNPV